VVELGRLVRPGHAGGQRLKPCADLRREVGVWSHVQDAGGVPARRPGLLVAGGDLILEQGGFPTIGQNDGPDQPQPFPRVKEQDGVGVGIARRVRQQERSAPLAGAPGFARAEDADIVGGALPGPVIPTNQEITVGTFHHTG